MSMAAITMTTIMAKQRSKILPREAGEDSLADAAALYRLMAWLSPAYPVGAFSYSGGIEWAVEAGDIKDAETLRRWLAVMLGEGGGFCDAVFFVHAHRAIAAADDTALRAVAELAAAFVPSKERFLETTAQGRAFLEATGAAWPCPALDALCRRLDAGRWRCRSRSASPARDMASRARRRSTPFSMRWWRTGSPPACG